MCSRCLNLIRVFENALNEMAFHRKEAINKLDDLSYNIVTHIILYLFVGGTAKKHWLSEINSWLDKLALYNRGKEGRVNYSYNLLKKYLITHFLEDDDDIKNILKRIEKKEGFKIPFEQVDKKILYTQMNHIIDCIMRDEELK